MGTVQVEIDGIVREAIDALGYIRPDAAPMLAGTIIPINEPLPPLPLAWCDADWCACRWDMHLDED